MKHTLSSADTTDFLNRKPSKKNTIYLKDYAVSGESFELRYIPEMFLYTTVPEPKAADLGQYYESENYISHTDSNKNCFEKCYQFVKQISFQNKLKLLNTFYSKENKLLDIGAGTGDFLAFLNKKSWNTTGYEPNSKARNLGIEKGVTYTEDLQNLPANSFDVITMWHVFEHVSNIDEQIKTLKRLIANNGSIVIAVPNFNSFDAQHYGPFWAAYDVPRHLRHFSKTAMVQLFKKYEMRVTEIHPMKFDAFYVSLLSEKHKHGKMNFVKAFYIGLLSNYKAKRNQEYSSLIYIIKNDQKNK